MEMSIKFLGYRAVGLSAYDNYITSGSFFKLLDFCEITQYPSNLEP